MTTLTSNSDSPLPGGEVIVTTTTVEDGVTMHVMHAKVVAFSDEALAILVAKIKEVLT